MNAHLGDEAELYPLGLLDIEQQRSVEAHAAQCALCAERLTQAQLVAASLAAALPGARPFPRLQRRITAAARGSHPAPRYTSLAGALAAVFLLAALVLAWQTIALRGRVANDNIALVTLVHSHFNHVSMTSAGERGVQAKILYARDGSWIYIIADNPRGALEASGKGASGNHGFGALSQANGVATLLVRPHERLRSVTLTRAGGTVASATLGY